MPFVQFRFVVKAIDLNNNCFLSSFSRLNNTIDQAETNHFEIIISKEIPKSFPIGIIDCPEMISPFELSRTSMQHSKTSIFLSPEVDCVCSSCVDSAEPSILILSIDTKDNVIYETNVDDTIVLIQKRDYDIDIDINNIPNHDLECFLRDQNNSINVFYNTHYDCHCRTRQVCGCNTNHDGW